MKRFVPAILALSVMAGIAGKVYAQTAEEISPNDTKHYYEQLDREGRGGNSGGN